MVFKITSSPFTHNQRDTGQIMMLVCLAALPGIAAQWYWFGIGTLIQLLLAMGSAMVAEALILRLRKKNTAMSIKDNSALLTGLLLGVSIPPLSPWWMIILGTVFAVVIAKQLYGGLGHNPFNPAMIGYVVLLIAFPVQMTSWVPPYSLANTLPSLWDSLSIIFHGHGGAGESLLSFRLNVDGISQATPLDAFKTGLHTGQSADSLLAMPLFSGHFAGVGWQWVNMAYLVGGVFLLWRGTIRWHIPLAFITTLALLASISWLLAPEKFLPPLTMLFSGATMLGAFFILTDPVTASTTDRGRLVFGALVALLVWLIRNFGGYPDGVAFAVLLGNITVPLIDYYTRPRPYGHR